VRVRYHHDHIRVFHIFQSPDDLVFVVLEMMRDLLIHPPHYFTGRIGAVLTDNRSHSGIKLLLYQLFGAQAGINSAAAHDVFIGNIKRFFSFLPELGNNGAVEGEVIAIEFNVFRNLITEFKGNDLSFIAFHLF